MESGIQPNQLPQKQSQKEIIYKELSFKIVGVLFSVHNELGRFEKEKRYSDLTELKLGEANLQYRRELNIGSNANIADFIIENLILLELKAKPSILKEDFRQIQNYLQKSQLKLGIIANFRNRYLKPVRIIRINKFKQ
ncbi:MAG: hypothetical protein A3H57_03895 [Candidatus Taylorbacteria bacterium RIFCSPLOWO2_02_FULL_43_11]|uniref:GxxExxY protein n=1 Tax=Candidatus Taylorbacteria bacterium RIFCSPHIGHO2_02_FULL_43_32b TaxID=1802306 RepID=A0A1G2MJN6_9BACT|nr:MAG: hypothetical protein A2743_01370 [Candidatus Taylorbacteria bacterium RIFCSPHIGHO2_01_FULL_43_47]OHA24058.1 MAG: hypothetical protein A3C72_02895 [Candidatus Taylorbacteria bacterium RIFCSPHIGHO2_02_FULL_43_32b]OHA31478.1 MAG: hypothetical protein A3B08_00850 [Candidatus Taylorbacteria bacterium RIFCSPLOWO2_01_FULL_43_44]OHA37530.1 MAG: hypothetical protein A3H57_03895 [Candidatus Taylorbacteria bacterium RIFCSPLOWO2_02_FULL_43_11]